MVKRLQLTLYIGCTVRKGEQLIIPHMLSLSCLLQEIYTCKKLMSNFNFEMVNIAGICRINITKGVKSTLLRQEDDIKYLREIKVPSTQVNRKATWYV